MPSLPQKLFDPTLWLQHIICQCSPKWGRPAITPSRKHKYIGQDGFTVSAKNCFSSFHGVIHYFQVKSIFNERNCLYFFPLLLNKCFPNNIILLDTLFLWTSFCGLCIHNKYNFENKKRSLSCWKSRSGWTSQSVKRIREPFTEWACYSLKPASSQYGISVQWTFKLWRSKISKNITVWICTSNYLYVTYSEGCVTFFFLI